MLYAWESDYLAISKDGRVYEVEIKVSHADFLNEAKNKKKKMQLLGGSIVTEEDFYGFKSIDYDRQMPKPNYFYYVCPQGVIAPEEVPEFAGLIYITEEEGFNTVKVAPELHRQKHSFAVESLRDKFYWGMWNWIRRYWRNVGKAKNKTERPERNVDVLVKLQDDFTGKIHYSMGYLNGACWFGDSIGATDHIIGWRPIND